MNPFWSDERKALEEIEEAWMEYSGYDTAPPGGGPALEKWEAFKSGWIASKSLGEIQRERMEHLRDVEAERDRYRDEYNFTKRQLIEATKRLDECAVCGKKLMEPNL